VYLIHQEDRLESLVLPVYGLGYVSTLRGYLGLAADLTTITGLRFYEQAETPGLGAKVQDPLWQSQWSGKKIRDSAGNLRIQVTMDKVAPIHADAQYAVDGISGATMTSRSVSNLLRYWLGPDGFGPFLRRLEQESQ
jgi:Na+-transporting NADH:ubiquinone oxidoreductase subunit C